MKKEVTPIRISEKAEENVMKVYYVIDNESTKILSYKVSYYKDGEEVEEDVEIRTKEVQVLEPDELEFDANLIDANKYEGYNLIALEEIPEIVHDKDIIKVYYERKEAKLIIEYKDKETDEEIAEKAEENRKYFDKYDLTEYNPEIEHYTLIEAPENLKGELTEDETILTYYYSKNKNIIIRYLDEEGNTISEERIEIKATEEYEGTAKEIEEYKYIKENKYKEDDVEVIEYIYKKIETKLIERHIDLYSEYVIKRKLMLFIHHIEVLEV